MLFEVRAAQTEHPKLMQASQHGTWERKVNLNLIWPEVLLPRVAQDRRCLPPRPASHLQPV